MIRQHLGVVGRLAVEVGARCGVPRAPPRHIIRDRVVGVERHVHDAVFHEARLDGVDGAGIATVLQGGRPAFVLLPGVHVGLGKKHDVLHVHVGLGAQGGVRCAHAGIVDVRGLLLVHGAIPAHERGGGQVSSPARVVVGSAGGVEERVAARPPAVVGAVVRAVVREPCQMALGQVGAAGSACGMVRDQQVRLERRQRAKRPAVAEGVLVFDAGREARPARSRRAQVVGVGEGRKRVGSRCGVQQGGIVQAEHGSALGFHHAAERLERAGTGARAGAGGIGGAVGVGEGGHGEQRRREREGERGASKSAERVAGGILHERFLLRVLASRACFAASR